MMITDFDAFDEKVASMDTAKVLVLHSQYVTLLEHVGKTMKGMLNCLIGDRVITTWNAAVPVGNHAQQVCPSFPSFCQFPTSIAPSTPPFFSFGNGAIGPAFAAENASLSFVTLQKLCR